MRVRNKDLDDIVIFFGGHCITTLATAFLRAICIQRYALDITGIRHRDNHIFACNQIFYVNIYFCIRYFCATRRRPVITNRCGFITDNLNNTFVTAQNIQQVFYQRAQRC